MYWFFLVQFHFSLNLWLRLVSCMYQTDSGRRPITNSHPDHKTRKNITDFKLFNLLYNFQPLIRTKGPGVKFMPCCMFMKKVPGIFVRSPSSCHPLLLLAVNFLAVNKQTYSHIQTELMSNCKQEEYWTNSRINFSSTYFSSGFR